MADTPSEGIAETAEEAALMRRVAAGDRDAATVLVDRHLAAITATARRMLGNAADAQDVAQEVFLRLWQQAGRWQPGRARLRTWLTRIALNLCLDRLRRRPSLSLEAVAEPVDPAALPGAALHQAAVTRKVEAALMDLPERQRAALALVHYQEMHQGEAAAALDISVEALESLLARGRRSLRLALAGDRDDLLGEL